MQRAKNFRNASLYTREVAVTWQPECIRLAPLGCLLKRSGILAKGSSFPEFESLSLKPYGIFNLSFFQPLHGLCSCERMWDLRCNLVGPCYYHIEARRSFCL